MAIKSAIKAIQITGNCSMSRISKRRTKPHQCIRFEKEQNSIPTKIARQKYISDGFYHCVYFNSIQQNVANLMRTAIFRTISTEYMIYYDCNGLTIAFLLRSKVKKKRNRNLQVESGILFLICRSFGVPCKR